MIIWYVGVANLTSGYLEFRNYSKTGLRATIVTNADALILKMFTQ